MTAPRTDVGRLARRWLRPAVPIVALLAIVALLGSVRGKFPDWLGGHSTPRVSHEVVVQQMRDVAKLVSTEVTLRDVVTFESSRYGSTKRGLYVVTGRVLAGIDLEKGTAVSIDHSRKRIAITLPSAQVIAVDVVSMRTYDERSGLFNPFRPEDRDAIQGQVRAQLTQGALQSGILQRADTSARVMLRALLARDGYEVDVGLPPLGLDRAKRQ